MSLDTVKYALEGKNHLKLKINGLVRTGKGDLMIAKSYAIPDTWESVAIIFVFYEGCTRKMETMWPRTVPQKQ